ncbi:Dabb family protein [Clostridium ganghwense]|uniref:Dabb family protein n=1 Tax=Clostridium ganghwense TaxID=312089 RepID=A0ABT4CQE3_9CLOT|nr:Dabb family protein [Clostridium ganghwense]MCY6371259.1 Dabb family protein [Clostridium ganghwense]
MFTHIVFFKLKEPSTENMEKAKNILESMRGKIPQLKDLEIGVDVVKSERSFDLALVTRFDSHEAMDEYQVHPFHVNEVLKNLKPMLEKSAAVDY